MAKAQSECKPVLEDLLQLFAASFQRLCGGPDAGAFGNVAVERPLVLDHLVASKPHRCLDVSREHYFILAVTFAAQVKRDSGGNGSRASVGKFALDALCRGGLKLEE